MAKMTPLQKELNDRARMIRDLVLVSHPGKSPFDPEVLYDMLEEQKKWALPEAPKPEVAVAEPEEVRPGKTISPGVTPDLKEFEDPIEDPPEETQ